MSIGLNCSEVLCPITGFTGREKTFFLHKRVSHRSDCTAVLAVSVMTDVASKDPEAEASKLLRAGEPDSAGADGPTGQQQVTTGTWIGANHHYLG